MRFDWHTICEDLTGLDYVLFMIPWACIACTYCTLLELARELRIEKIGG
jgi:hypothetical protein